MFARRYSAQPDLGINCCCLQLALRHETTTEPQRRKSWTLVDAGAALDAQRPPGTRGVGDGATSAHGHRVASAQISFGGGLPRCRSPANSAARWPWVGAVEPGSSERSAGGPSCAHGWRRQAEAGLRTSSRCRVAGAEALVSASPRHRGAARVVALQQAGRGVEALLDRDNVMCWAAAVRQRVRHVIDRGCGDRVS